MVLSQEVYSILQLLTVVYLLCMASGKVAYGSDGLEHVEWFGEPRGGLDSFYDLVYDDEACAGELRSEAVSNHIFLGGLLTSLYVRSSTDCMQECYLNSNCRSANYFIPGLYHKNQGYCELLNETQWDNMSRTMWWMRPYKGATHYEHIQCYQPQYYDTNMVIRKHMKKMNSKSGERKVNEIENLKDAPSLTNKHHKKMDPFAQNLFKKLGDYMKNYKHK